MPSKDQDKLKASKAKFLKNHPGYFAKKASIRKLYLRSIIDTLKKDKPCRDCGGIFHPVSMDFDHVRGKKKFGIAKAWVHGVSEKSLLEEFDKCELVCSNCHRVRTFMRKAGMAESADAAVLKAAE